MASDLRALSDLGCLGRSDASFKTCFAPVLWLCFACHGCAQTTVLQLKRVPVLNSAGKLVKIVSQSLVRQLADTPSLLGSMGDQPLDVLLQGAPRHGDDRGDEVTDTFKLIREKVGERGGER